MLRRSFIVFAIVIALLPGLFADDFKFPLKSGSVKFAVIVWLTAESVAILPLVA